MSNKNRILTPVTPESALAGQYQTGAFGQTDAFGPPGAGLTICEKLIEDLVIVGAWPESRAAVWKKVQEILSLSKPLAIGQNAGQGNQIFSLITPQKAWVLTSKEKIQKLKDAFTEAEAVISDLGHSRVRLNLEGFSVVDLLSRGFAIDFAALPDGAVTSTAFHHISLMIHKKSSENYEFLIPRAFAVSVFKWVMETGKQFGLRII